MELKTSRGLDGTHQNSILFYISRLLLCPAGPGSTHVLPVWKAESQLQQVITCAESEDGVRRFDVPSFCGKVEKVGTIFYESPLLVVEDCCSYMGSKPVDVRGKDHQ
ncbi:hypothetical protein M378DRAFT_160908 [Amanita muscaria Koide BX008]|uniref:Uncharacterized protein n=1 Tax=Amanita muscaria (strain Koide BX008) TaxID=946122 RepID=A0A0C2SSW8_AMAMK|nr:hypothetical protein M378DRAFT_160908 [Amanita muscaria Koide BX008]